MNCKPEPLFHEEQRFPQMLLRTRLLLPPIVLLVIIIWRVVLGHPSERLLVSNTSLIGWTIFLWLLYLRLVTVRLVTEIRPGGLFISLRGLWPTRCIRLIEARSVNIVNYDPMRDFGGYGIRSARHKKAYIARGNRAVQLALADGTTLLIGSQRPEELVSAIYQSIDPFGAVGSSDWL
jgi:uncharacterized protein DUF6141